jgi:hypothetical protein
MKDEGGVKNISFYWRAKLAMLASGVLPRSFRDWFIASSFARKSFFYFLIS